MICLNNKKILNLWEKGKKASINECEQYYPQYLKIINAIIGIAEDYINNDDFMGLHKFNIYNREVPIRRNETNNKKER